MCKLSMIFVVFAAWLGSGTVLAQQSPGKVVSKEDVREAISIFQRDPLHLQGSTVRLAILQYAHDSDDVSVLMDPKLLPWLENKTLREEDRTNLLTAYFAGNVRSQLDKGKAKNDSLAGCEQVIATYRQLMKSEPGLKIPEIENLIDLQKQGKLAQYLEPP